MNKMLASVCAGPAVHFANKPRHIPCVSDVYSVAQKGSRSGVLQHTV